MVCINTIGYFVCDCYHGFIGDACEKYVFVDDCETRNFKFYEQFDNYECVDATPTVLNQLMTYTPQILIGYTLNEKNKCSCENGNVDLFCEKEGTEKCRSCDYGYHLDKNVVLGAEEVVLNVFDRLGFNEELRNMVEGMDVTVRNFNVDTGNHPSCPGNKCKCDNGIGTEVLNCENHGEFKCEACDFGYHLNNFECDANLCDCENGFNASLTECGVHGADVCAECQEGYHPNIIQTQLKNGSFFDNIYCDLNLCLCDRGNSFEGTFCPTHGDTRCSDCIQGYYLTKLHKCFANVCTCGNGYVDPVKISCPENGAEFCQSCASGYHLVDNICDRNICGCDNGQPVLSCLKNGEKQCESCDSGYFLTNNKCELKQCTCENGIASIGVDCPV